MNSKIFIENWSKTRQKGYVRYIGIRVILSVIFGLVGGILTTWLSYITWNSTTLNSMHIYAGSAIIGSIIGVLMVANSSWKSNEKRYLNCR